MRGLREEREKACDGTGRRGRGARCSRSRFSARKGEGASAKSRSVIHAALAARRLERALLVYAAADGARPIAAYQTGRALAIRIEDASVAF